MEHLGDGVLSLAWQPEKADYTEAFGARNKAKKAWYKIGALAGIGVVLAGVGLVTGDRSLLTLGAFVAVGFPLAAAVLQPLSVRSFWRKNAACRAPLRAHVDPATGITLIGQSTGQHPWATVHSFLETSRVYVVQLSGYRSLGFLLLAKRGLRDEQQVDDLRRLLTERATHRP